MRSLLARLKNDNVRSSAQSALNSAAGLPDFGFAFVNNSQGASAALSELSATFDTALEYVGIDGDLEENSLKNELQRLDKAAGEYANSSSEHAANLNDWACSKNEAQTVSVAFQCAANVYNSATEPKLTGYSFSNVEYVPSTSTGTAKAIGFWNVDQNISEDETNSHFPALVIAIKGTTSHVDHMVNANGKGRDIATFLELDELAIVKNGWLDPICAHSGFLNSAKALLPIISQHISRLSAKGNVKHVVFTGHSAGGAVASLIFMKSLLGSARSHPSLRFSCVTFGSPPVISRNITATLAHGKLFTERRGLVLSFVNEFDLVTRADQAYVRSLVDMYRSIYNLPAMMEKGIKRAQLNEKDKTESVEYILPPLRFQQEDEEKADEPVDKIWTLPVPDYYLIGELVLLRRHNDARENVEEFKEGQGRRKVVRALSIRAEELAKLVFTGIEIHSRRFYEDRIKAIAEGKFNYADGWN